MGGLYRDNIIGFVITEIDKDLYDDRGPYADKCLYTIEINYKPKYFKIRSFNMGFYSHWEDLLNVDMWELKKHLSENYGSHRKIGPSRIICWDNRESAQRAVEYLESLMIINKLTE